MLRKATLAGLIALFSSTSFAVSAVGSASPVTTLAPAQLVLDSTVHFNRTMVICSTVPDVPGQIPVGQLTIMRRGHSQTLPIYSDLCELVKSSTESYSVVGLTDDSRIGAVGYLDDGEIHLFPSSSKK